MKEGMVTTGFSKPWVALYSNVGTTVTYSGARRLARGVNVNINPESSDDNNFYADNVEAESAAGMFAGGTVESTVDGLLTETERMIAGLPEPDADGFTNYGEEQNPPYVGYGFVRRAMSGGATYYQPFILPKVKFNNVSTEAATQEDEIDWQTQSLTAAINRDDTVNKNWKKVGALYDTEAEAEQKIKDFFSYVEPTPLPDPKLTTLTIGALTLTPAFDADVDTYTATTENATDVITATAEAGLTVAIMNGSTPVDSGDAATWTLGSNTVTVTVSNGEESKTYTVTVTALAEAVLSNLEIGALTLTPAFDADVDTYTASTTNATDTITATADASLTVTILNGSTPVDNGDPATWQSGDNTVTVEVTNGVSSKTYTVTVTAP